MDNFDLDANLAARSAALKEADDAELRSIPTLLLLTQFLSSTQGLTDAIRHPELDADQVAGALRIVGMEETARAYVEALGIGPPKRIHSDDIDVKSWPGKQQYLQLRRELEQLGGDIVGQTYALARRRWVDVSPLPADEAVLRHLKALKKRLPRRLPQKV